MLKYPKEAITSKTINKFNFRLYLAASINQLKYNNDSSASLRLLSSIIDAGSDVIEDIPYKPSFNYNGLDFININKISGYPASMIYNFSIVESRGILSANQLYGYSRYTDKTYEMEIVQDPNDFIAHSLPCDAFLSGFVTSPVEYRLTLSPNIKEYLNITVDNTSCTIKQISGFNESVLNGASKISILIQGLDVINKSQEEIIEINNIVDIKTEKEYSFITSLMLLGSSSTAEIEFMPYICGDIEIWDNGIINKDTGEEYETVITVDTDNKLLQFNILNNNEVTYPSIYDLHKTVPLEIPTNENITNYFIDIPNKLLYITTDASNLYCFPLIIPKTDTSILDKMKTKYQSIRVEYEEDCQNEIYNLWIFPTSRYNDVEILNITINDEVFLTDIILDLYKENINTNRIAIPFSTLFNSAETALVKFYSSGTYQSEYAIFLDRTKLKPLYIKDISEIDTFSSTAPENFIKPALTNSLRQYKETKLKMHADRQALFKTSSTGNILVNGIRIHNVFKTFAYHAGSNIIVTSDTITALSGESNGN